MYVWVMIVLFVCVCENLQIFDLALSIRVPWSRHVCIFWRANDWLVSCAIWHLPVMSCMCIPNAKNCWQPGMSPCPEYLFLVQLRLVVQLIEDQNQNKHCYTQGHLPPVMSCACISTQTCEEPRICSNLSCRQIRVFFAAEQDKQCLWGCLRNGWTQQQ